MKRFPATVRRAMRETGAAATCVPVRLDGGGWEAALFIQLADVESEPDRRLLARAGTPVPVAVETDLIENENAAVVVLRLETYARPDDPLAVEILLTPGNANGHFDTLNRLANQPRLCWFFADRDFHVIHAQQHALNNEQHAGFDALLRDAAVHDAVIRCTGRYNAQSALASIVSHYELRAGIKAQQGR